MKRRDFIRLLSALGCGSPLLALAQHGSPNIKVGWLSFLHPSADARRIAEFTDGLQSLAYIEGHNLSVDWRFASNLDQVPTIVTEWVHTGIQAIVVGPAGIAQLVRKITSTVPIIVTSAGDLEGTGLIATLARPGGNVTGVQILSPELMSKRLDLLKQLAPGLQQVGVVEPITPGEIITSNYLNVISEAAKAIGVQVQREQVRQPDEFGSAFVNMRRAGTGGALVIANPLSVVNKEKVVAAAAEYRIPTVYEVRDFAKVGGLLSYGVDLGKLPRMAASYIDQIAKGANPGDLPIQQPTVFEMVINLQTAKALDIAVSPELLARADEVIE